MLTKTDLKLSNEIKSSIVSAQQNWKKNLAIPEFREHLHRHFQAIRYSTNNPAHSWITFKLSEFLENYFFPSFVVY